MTYGILKIMYKMISLAIKVFKRLNLKTDKAQNTLLKYELTLSENTALHLAYFTPAILLKNSNRDQNESVHCCLIGKTDHFLFLLRKRGKSSLKYVAFCADGHKQQPVTHIHHIPLASLGLTSVDFQSRGKNAINLFIRTIKCVEVRKK